MILTAALALAQVVAPAAAAPTAQGVISYPPAFFASFQPANAQEMLQRLPGFSIENGDSVRGFEGAAGNVLIDGQRPATKSESVEEVLRRVPTDQVERIELIRGGAPGVDMQGRSILANVIRKPGRRVQGVAIVSHQWVYDGRKQPNVRLELSGGFGDRKWEGSARFGQGTDDGAGEGPQTRLGPGGAPIRLSAVDSQGTGINHTLTGAYEQPLLGGRIRVNGRLFWDKYKYQEDNLVRFPAPDALHTDDVSTSYDTELGARFNRALGAKTTLEAVALRQTEDGGYVSDFRNNAGASRFALDSTSTETIGRLVIRRRQSDGLSFELGGEGAFNVLDSATAYAENGGAIVLPAANVRVEETRGEVFAKSVWKPWTTLTLEAGLRYEGSSIASDGDVSLEKSLYFAKPRLAATWAANPYTQVRARFERVVGQLDFDDFVADSSLNTGVVTSGNPDLNPEQAWVSEIAVERRFWNDGVVSLTARHSALSDVIDRAPVFAVGGQVFDAPANIGGGTKDEIAVDLTLPLAKLGLTGGQLKAQGTWRRSRVTDPTTGESRPISRLRPLDWEATYSQDIRAWKSTVGAMAFGGWRETYYRFDQIENRKLKTYLLLFAEHRPRADIAVRFELQNATARGFRRTRYVYSGPRDVNPFAYVDDRDIQFGRMYWARVRKTF